MLVGKRFFQHKLAKYLVATVLFSMVTGLQASYQKLDKVVAVVDDGVVLESELKNRISSITTRLAAQNTPLPPAEVLRERILEQLIIEHIQLQMAERGGMRISDNHLTETMVNIAARNGMSLEDFELAIQSEGITFAEAREQIRREMITSRLQQSQVGNRIRITDKEVENFLASAAGRQDIDYLLGHILIALPENPTPAQLEIKKQEVQSILAEIRSGTDFRQMAVARSDGRNALEGGVLGWRKEKELPTIAATIIPAMEVGEVSEPIQTESGFHLVTVLEKRGGASQIVEQRQARHILIKPTEIRTKAETRKAIKEVAQRLAAGEDFAELAKALSDDNISAVSGGDLGWVSPGDMVKEFDEVMYRTGVDEYSEPFKSPFGWHILQVTDIRQQDIGEKLLASQAREALTRRKYDVELIKWLQEIRGEAYVEFKNKPSPTGEKTP